jgi:hypothetical protein
VEYRVTVDDDDDEQKRANILALSGSRTHGVSVKVINSFASDSAATGDRLEHVLWNVDLETARLSFT